MNSPHDHAAIAATPLAQIGGPVRSVILFGVTSGRFEHPEAAKFLYAAKVALTKENGQSRYDCAHRYLTSGLAVENHPYLWEYVALLAFFEDDRDALMAAIAKWYIACHEKGFPTQDVDRISARFLGKQSPPDAYITRTREIPPLPRG